MNASSATINPVNPVQTQAASGKQSDAASPDVPFSQVLSGEIAQNKQGSDTKTSPTTQVDPKAGKKDASKADQKQDPKTDPQTADASVPLAGVIPPVTDTAADKAAGKAQQADGQPASPDTFLGLAIQPDQNKLEPAIKGDALPRQTMETDGKAALPPDAHKGRPQAALQADPRAERAASSQKADAALQGKAAVSDFAEKLIAARQPDALKPQDPSSDMLGNTALRGTTHAPQDVSPALNSMAASKLAPSVGSTAWGQALGDKVVWMAAGAQQSATLTLNPPNLGPLHIELNISNDQATASFFSTHPEVRHALESAFPRLREMMNDAGIQLGQATVSADTPQQNDTSDRQAQRLASSFPGMKDTSVAGQPSVLAPVQRSGSGLVDTFA